MAGSEGVLPLEGDKAWEDVNNKRDRNVFMAVTIDADGGTNVYRSGYSKRLPWAEESISGPFFHVALKSTRRKVIDAREFFIWMVRSLDWSELE